MSLRVSAQHNNAFQNLYIFILPTIACRFNHFLVFLYELEWISDVSKTFVTRPRSRPRPYEQDQDQDFEILLEQDQDQDQSSKTKTKTSEPKSRPRLYFYDSDKKWILARHVFVWGKC